MPEESVATIFNVDGEAIGDIIASFERQWVLNDYGEMNFKIDISTVRNNPTLFQIGNYILIEHKTLPDWVGFIDTPIPFGNGEVQFNCYSAEKLFDHRPGRNAERLTGTYGSIFTKIIQNFNEWGSSILFEGDIYTGGNHREESIAPSNSLYEDIVRIASRSGYYWSITPEVVAGKLKLNCNWFETILERVGFAYAEGFNMELKNVEVELEGDIWTAILAYGNSATWTSREIFFAEDDDAISKYGLRILPLSVDSNVPASVEYAAKEALKFYKQPRNRFEISTTDHDPAFYQYARLGNIPEIEFVNSGLQDDKVGISTLGVIFEMVYDHEGNKLDLVIQEYFE